MNNQPQTDRDRLIALAKVKSTTLFHAPDKTAYVTFDVDGHRETHMLKGKQFELYLGKLFWKKHKTVCSKSAFEDALGLLEGLARFEGPEKRVYRKVAHLNGKIYIDLCDEDWRVVEITRTRWRVLKKSPVKFVRSMNAQPLPEPKRKGSIEQLRPCINASDDGNWILLVAWLLGTLQPYGAYHILILQGEQDSGKSVTMRTLRQVIEPTIEKIRRMPSNARDLMIAAKHNHILAFDNLSGVTRKMSDALCTTATGIGQAGRTLYSNDDEHIVRAKRPIMLNGIDDVARRADLLDRSIVLRLPSIKARKTERELDAEFENAWPFILGAIFDSACKGLANYDKVRTDDLPRMADFCQWVIACEEKLPWEPGEFLKVYRENKRLAEESLLASEGLVVVLEKFIEVTKPIKGVYFEGTPTELLGKLQDRELQHFETSLLPKKPHWLTNDLRRLNPALRRVLEIEFVDGKRTKNRRLVCVRRVGDRATG